MDKLAPSYVILEDLIFQIIPFFSKIWFVSSYSIISLIRVSSFAYPVDKIILGEVLMSFITEQSAGSGCGISKIRLLSTPISVVKYCLSMD